MSQKNATFPDAVGRVKDLCFAFLFVLSSKGDSFKKKIQEPVENILEAMNQPDYLCWRYAELYSFSEVRNYQPCLTDRKTAM